MPDGVLVTVPAPEPAFVTVRFSNSSNVAVQVLSASIVITPFAQSALPLQPVKTEPAAAAGLSATRVPVGKEAAVLPQEVPHVRPAGSLVTEPEPVPAFCRVRMKLPGSGRAVCKETRLLVDRPSPTRPCPLIAIIAQESRKQ